VSHKMDGMKEPHASNVHCRTVMSEFLRWMGRAVKRKK